MSRELLQKILSPLEQTIQEEESDETEVDEDRRYPGPLVDSASEVFGLLLQILDFVCPAT